MSPLHAPSGQPAPARPLGAATAPLPRPPATGAPPGGCPGRARSTVGILGLGRTGLLTALGLSAAGVGRLVLDDPDHVTPDDLGLGGYTQRDIGSLRRTAAARAVAAASDGRRVTRATPARPDDMPLGSLDALIVITRRDLSPDRTWRLMGERVPHLVVRCRNDSVDVSPVVVPGRTPCLRCLALHAQDESGAGDAFTPAHWGAGTAPWRADAPAPSLDPLLASAAAVVTTATVLAHLDARHAPPDGGGPRVPAARVVASRHVALPDVTVREERWPVHPQCGCTGQVAVPSDDASAAR